MSSQFPLPSLFDFVKLTQSIGSHVLGNVSNRLVDYMVSDEGPNFNDEEALNLMLYRTAYDDLPDLGINAQSTTVFKKKFDLLAKNNKAYYLATKVNPTAKDLSIFSKIRPCWSTLFPIKCYLCDHPKEARKYRGMQPFGKFVIRFFNAVIDHFDPDEMEEGPEYALVGSQPTFSDHCRLREMTNRCADLTGMSTVAVNNYMYMIGQEL